MQERAQQYRAAIAEMAARCTSCGKCVRPCHFLRTHGSPAYLAQRGDEPDTISLAMQCSLCGACDARCPLSLQPSALFLAMRQEAQRQNLIDLAPYQPWLRYESLGRSRLFRRYHNPHASTVAFFPGCSFPGGRPAGVMTLYRLIQQVTPHAGLVLDCCNKISHDLGTHASFESHLTSLHKRLQDHGFTTLLTACPGCTSIFERYAATEITCKNVYQYLVEQGATIPETYNASGTVRLHDPCPSRFDNVQQKAVRYLLAQTGVKLEEIPEHGRSTRCCGQGGMVEAILPGTVAQEATLLHDTAAGDPMVTTCGGCCEALGRTGTVMHLADLLHQNGPAPKATTTSLGKWLNRLKLRFMRLV